MNKQLFSNNAKTTINGGITNVAVSIVLAAGKGALFSSPSAGQFEMATIYSGDSFEIVKITGRSTDTLTVVRGQDGTSAIAWATGAYIEARITKGTLERFYQNSIAAVEAGTDGIAIGNTASAPSADSIAVGTSSSAQGAGSIAFGKLAATFAANEIAIGSTSQAQGASSISIGYLSDTYGDYQVALGHNPQVQGVGSVGIGKNANTFGAANIAVGEDSQAQGLSSISIGKLTDTYNDYGIALGHNTQVAYSATIGIGKDVVVNANGAMAIGEWSRANTDTSIAIGARANNPDLGATPAARANTTAYALDDVRLIAGNRCRVVMAGTTAGSAPSVPGDVGAYFLDGTAAAGVVWIHEPMIQPSMVAIGTDAHGDLAIGTGAISIAGTAVGYNAFANENSIAMGPYARCFAKNSIAVGQSASNHQVQYSLATSVLPVMAQPPSWWFGAEYKEYVGLEGLLASEFMDLAGGATWAATTGYRHGEIVKPTVPNGNQYSRWDNAYYSSRDPSLLHYVASPTGGSQPTWPTTFGDSVSDGDGDWICIPHDGTYVMALPCDMVIEEVMFICYLATAITVQANVSIGTTGDLTKVLNNQPTVGLTADKTVTKWALAQPVMVPDITIKIDTLATGTKMWGKFMFKGFYTKYL